MKRNPLFGMALLLGLSAFAPACAARSGYVVRYAPAPPPPRAVGIIGVAPGPGYVWTDGYWDWRGRDWYWVSGRWVRPPYPRAMWVPGRWSHHRHGYAWTPGYWRRR